MQACPNQVVDFKVTFSPENLVLKSTLQLQTERDVQTVTRYKPT